MIRDLLDKFIFWVYKKSSKYVYDSYNINKDNVDDVDKEYWEDL